jgi:ubiquitin C-terminal hydrolase
LKDEDVEHLPEQQLFNLQNDMHLKVNQSVIQDLFFGQFKSSV